MKLLKNFESQNGKKSSVKKIENSKNVVYYGFEFVSPGKRVSYCRVDQIISGIFSSTASKGKCFLQFLSLLKSFNEHRYTENFKKIVNYLSQGFLEPRNIKKFQGMILECSNI